MSNSKLLTLASALLLGVVAHAQTIDRTTAPNAIDAGIAKSLVEQVGTGRGDTLTPGSSVFIIARDPFRAIRRGRQLFQRTFTAAEGLGPRGSAGFGGDVATRPDSRDALHLFGLGLKETLAGEITQDLRAIRDTAVLEATQLGR